MKLQAGKKYECKQLYAEQKPSLINKDSSSGNFAVTSLSSIMFYSGTG